MARVYRNWERLVDAIFEGGRVQAGHQDQPGTQAGLAAAVPPSLEKRTNIDAILQAATLIEDEDPNVARILCEQAYTMAQDLDPNSEGRGVLQFKTGLMSVIKQKLSKKDGGKIDRDRDIERLWEFYESYKQRHRVDDIQEEEKKWRESGAFSGQFGELERKSLGMRKVYATQGALMNVMKTLSKDAPNEGVVKKIRDELRKVKQSDAALSEELTPYNIVPMGATSLTNAIGLFPEVKAALSAIRYLDDFARLPREVAASSQGNLDMFDLLKFVFGFQDGNVRNQRENVVLGLANAQSRLEIPEGTEPRLDEKAITKLFLKVMDNYIKWSRYLHIRPPWLSIEEVNREKKLIFISLYFLIWGEAANIRFLPECICYIFHNMAKELDDILVKPEAEHAKSCCVGDEGNVSFHHAVVKPIYDIMAAETGRNKNGQASHFAWRNYDDFNEFFWSPSCLDLKWPLHKQSRFFLKPKKWKRTGKTGFVEHRTFLHLYRSFHRLWIFLAMMFQALAIIAFNDGKFNADTFMKLLSLGPTYLIMNFAESCLDILLMFGAYRTTRALAITRVFIRFLWFGCTSLFITFIYVKLVQEGNNQFMQSLYFRIYILALGIYAAVRIAFAMILKFPSFRTLSDICEQWSFFQFFKWMFEERYFVGRGLYESFTDYIRYVAFWLVIFVCKFIFAYFLQIKPLVNPTNIILNLSDLPYKWHDLVSSHNHNALTIASFWAPVVAIYILDLHIWYTLLSALVGGIMGAYARLGEIRTIEMLHKRFESFPEAFVKNLVSADARRLPSERFSSEDPTELNKIHAAKFGPFWNEIINSLREEDYLSNRERDLLLIPSNSGSLRIVQWPLFLLSSKIFMAIELAVDCKDTQLELWNRISKDEYMAYAVQECYYSIEKILLTLTSGEGRLWVERIFREVSESISERSVLVNFRLKKLNFVISRITALTGLLIRNESPELRAGVAKSVYDLYEVVTHELLSDSLREQFDTWNILARARNEGRLFSRVDWPNDPEIVCCFS